MTNLLILVQMALLVFIAAGGVLALLYLAWNAGRGSGFSRGTTYDFESHFRRGLARRKGAAPF